MWSSVLVLKCESACRLAPGGGSTPLYELGYIDMCSPKGNGSLALLIRNRVSILAILVSNGVCFLHCSLELGVVF